MASLSEDLTTIRKGQKKSLTDLYDSTRIPIPTIEQVENGTIFENLAHNEVYLRSYIRTYAKALKISDDDILKALEETKAGSYSGFLVKKYSGKISDKSVKDEPDAESEEKDSRPDTGNGRKKVFTPENLNPKREKTLKDIEEEDKEAVKSQHTSTSYTQDPSISKFESVDWAGVVKKSKGINKKSGAVISIIILVILGIVGGVIWFYEVDTGVTDTPDIPQATQTAPETTAPATADTLEDVAAQNDGFSEAAVPATEEAPPAEVEMPTSEGFGDTLEVLVFAAHDKLEPFFIGTNNGTANAPYWIEHMTAMRIPFTEEINVRGQFSRMKLIFNGYEIENFMDFYGENRTVSIPRSFFEENADWATAASEDEITYSLPQEIIDRP